MSAKLVKRPDMAKIMRQVTYGTAVGLSKTAVEGKNAAIDAMKEKFIIRTNWLTSPIGVKTRPATKLKLTAEIYTGEKIPLRLHEEGGTKFPLRNHIAVPTQFARPNPGSRIKAADRPRALIDSGKAAIVKDDNGTTILYAHRGPKNGWVPMYILTPRAKEPKVDIWEKPISKVVKANVAGNVKREIGNALAVMR